MLDDFDFRLRRPDPPLGDAVESVWFARGTVPYEREQISPTGSTVVVLVLGDPIEHAVDGGSTVTTASGFVVGPHDRPATNAPQGVTHAVGIVTTTTGCRASLGIAPATVRGQVAHLEDAWPDGVSLRTRLLTTDDPEAALDLVVEHLVGMTSPRSDRAARCATWVDRIEADPALPIHELATSAGVSYGHLVSEMTEHTGLTPRALARLLRLRRVIAEIDIEPTDRWADIAHRHGWYDQAHFIRDFKRHTGVTPGDYVDRQRRAFRPGQAVSGSGVGFVPEL